MRCHHIPNNMLDNIACYLLNKVLKSDFQIPLMGQNLDKKEFFLNNNLPLLLFYCILVDLSYDISF